MIWRTSAGWVCPWRVGIRRIERGERALYVPDNGLGIPGELQHRVFEQFFRAHPEVAEGAGRGLAIARHAVEQRDGRIRFESEPGRGTTLFVVVPLLQERAGA